MKDSELKKHLNPSLYRILCVGRNATQKTIKDAYRGLQKFYHPDVTKENKDHATEKIQEINLAYKILTNPELKTRYDQLYDTNNLSNTQKKASEENERKKNNSEEKKTATENKQSSKPKIKTYLISYGLNDENDAELYEILKKFPSWWHGLDSTWIINSPLKAREIRDMLKPLMAKGNNLLVIRVYRDAATTGFGNEYIEWLKKNLTD